MIQLLNQSFIWNDARVSTPNQRLKKRYKCNVSLKRGRNLFFKGSTENFKKASIITCLLLRHYKKATQFDKIFLLF